MMISTIATKNPKLAEMVRHLHDEVKFLEKEAPDLALHTRTQRRVRLKRSRTTDGRPFMKPVTIITTDNTERWKMLKSLYWFETVVLPTAMKEAKSC